MTAATFSTTCARCAAPLEVTDATADDAVKAHEERCFVVGDYVRWDNRHDANWHARDPRWFEGAIVDIYLTDHGWRAARIRIARGSEIYVAGDYVSYSNTANIRRIPRPEPEVKPCTGTWTHAEPMLHHCSQDDGHPGNCYDYPPSRSEPLYREPQIYDGLTADQCLARMRARVAAADGLIGPAEIPGWPPGRTVHQELEDGRLAITESQLAAARDLWQSQLRAKVAASSERERLTVMVEQDAEDEPW